MCFKAPAPPKPPPLPNQQDNANQAAVQASLQRVRKQDPSNSTILTGGLGDSGFGQNINKVTALGRTV